MAPNAQAVYPIDVERAYKSLSRIMALKTLQHYLDFGINIGIGTESYPLDLLEKMRVAALAIKLVTKNFEVAHARDVLKET